MLPYNCDEITDWGPLEEKIKKYLQRMKADKAFIVTDITVNQLIINLMPKVPRALLLEGERNKTIIAAENIWDTLRREGATRHSVILNIGGGMVSDIGGFAASAYMRGIRYINMPTTLLGAVDAAVGGKTGVNFMGLKNMVGAFWMPTVVMPLTPLFDTLPEDQWLSGCGEAIKTAIIAGGDWLERIASDAFMIDREPTLVNKVVEFCMNFKAKIVEDDMRDHGKRKILNFGHTYGHALEEAMLEKQTPVPHGIAVAYGIEYALRLSVEYQNVGKDLLVRYRKILKKYFPPLELTSSDKARINQLMSFDKKNKQFGKPQFVLLGDVKKILGA